MTPYLSDPDFTLYQGDALETLKSLPSESVQCVLTSPPFYALRDYGTAEWIGGDPDSPFYGKCDHKAPPTGGPNPERYTSGGGEMFRAANDKQYARLCGKCGAKRVDQQIGLEATPEAWCDALVAVFRELRRVLRKDGTLWVECGDSYGSSSTYNTTNSLHTEHGWKQDGERRPNVRAGGGLKPKDLLGQPWMLAFALRADGWYLRQCIVWHKPNAMPESATDRCTTAHSYLFLFSKSPRYFFDADAISEPAEWARWGDQTVPKYEGTETSTGWMQPKSKSQLRAMRTASGSWESGGLENGKSTWPDGRKEGGPTEGARKNARSVWTIPTQGYAEAHFATWPEKLVERIILAGTSERGCCPECGAPWERETEVESSWPARKAAGAPKRGNTVDGQRGVHGSGFHDLDALRRETTGWRPTCKCFPGIVDGYFCPENHPVPCTVLDPFSGAGTTALVARRLGRRSIGIELNPDYCKLTAERTHQLSLEAA